MVGESKVITDFPILYPGFQVSGCQGYINYSCAPPIEKGGMRTIVNNSEIVHQNKVLKGIPSRVILFTKPELTVSIGIHTYQQVMSMAVAVLCKPLQSHWDHIGVINIQVHRSHIRDATLVFP